MQKGVTGGCRVQQISSTSLNDVSSCSVAINEVSASNILASVTETDYVDEDIVERLTVRDQASSVLEQISIVHTQLNKSIILPSTPQMRPPPLKGQPQTTTCLEGN